MFTSWFLTSSDGKLRRGESHKAKALGGKRKWTRAQLGALRPISTCLLWKLSKHEGIVHDYASLCAIPNPTRTTTDCVYSLLTVVSALCVRLECGKVTLLSIINKGCVLKLSYACGVMVRGAQITPFLMGGRGSRQISHNIFSLEN